MSAEGPDWTKLELVRRLSGNADAKSPNKQPLSGARSDSTDTFDWNIMLRGDTDSITAPRCATASTGSSFSQSGSLQPGSYIANRHLSSATHKQLVLNRWAQYVSCRSSFCTSTSTVALCPQPPVSHCAPSCQPTLLAVVARVHVVFSSTTPTSIRCAPPGCPNAPMPLRTSVVSMAR